uniref:Saccharopine dehydrogenase NADP binding domain-containing protein n=1 Tax=Megaselia scalaris TaxID=36166 RepID=T1GDL3_MEGSC
VVVNTCGPYRFYGEQVVEACIKAGTHHVDVSGEPQYMETMQLKYNEEAAKKNVYIISACGFDSIPNDLGTVFVEKNFNGVVNSVETYLETGSSGNKSSGASLNYGTWESAVYGLTHAKELKGIRSQLFKDQSTISDIEVDTIEVKGPTSISVPGYEKNVTFGVLYDVAYKIIGTDEEIVVSTTRLKRSLEMWQSLNVDAQVWHPFRNEPIPIIFDLGVDKDFGTGAVKITPAHDKLDFDVGNRHLLNPIQVFTEDGRVDNHSVIF